MDASFLPEDFLHLFTIIDCLKKINAALARLSANSSIINTGNNPGILRY